MEALHIDVSTHRRLHTHTRLLTQKASTRNIFSDPCLSRAAKPCTQELLGAEAFTHRCVYIYVLTRKQRASPFSQRLWHTGAFTQSTRKLLHTAVANNCFCTEVFALTLLRIVRASAFLHSNCYARKPFTRTHRCFYTRASTYGKLLHTESFTRGGLYKQAFTCRSSCTREREPCTAAKG